MRVEGLYFLCNKNKGTDKLRGNRICKNQVSHDAAQIVYSILKSKTETHSAYKGCNVRWF